MLYRVGAVTGDWDVIGLRRRMSARQLVGWRHYFELEKFLPTAAAWHAAIGAKAAYDAAGITRKDGTRFAYEDFLLKEAVPVKVTAPEAEGWRASLAIAHVIARAQNHIAAGGK